MWTKFKNEYNSNVVNPNSKLNDGRKAEFITFVLSGQFGNFDVSDTVAAYVSGDIFKKVGEKNVHTQIKRAGGVFKMAYSESHLRNRQIAYYNMYVGNVNSAITEEEFVDHFSKVMREANEKSDQLIQDIESGKAGRQDIGTKIKIIRQYLNQTKGATEWYLFYLANSNYWAISPNLQGPGIERVESGFIVHTSKMINFVAKNPHLFKTDVGMKKNSNKINSLGLVFLGDNLTLPQFWDTGAQNLAFLINPVEPGFFAIRHSQRKKNSVPVERYMEFVKPSGTTRGDFILVYESLFGALTYK